ncbi:unnamed protein product [Ixodes persulcatus]
MSCHQSIPGHHHWYCNYFAPGVHYHELIFQYVVFLRFSQLGLGQDVLVGDANLNQCDFLRSPVMYHQVGLVVSKGQFRLNLYVRFYLYPIIRFYLFNFVIFQLTAPVQSILLGVKKVKASDNFIMAFLVVQVQHSATMCRQVFHRP